MGSKTINPTHVQTKIEPYYESIPNVKLSHIGKLFMTLAGQ
jgi:hypothetical protein